MKEMFVKTVKKIKNLINLDIKCNLLGNYYIENIQ